MGSKVFARPEGNGCVISVDATPGADTTGVSGVNEWRGSLQVRLGAQAKGGEANEELVRFIAEALGVPKREVVIRSGHTSSRKTVFVPVRAERAQRILGGD